MAQIQGKNRTNCWSFGTVNRTICGLAALSHQESNFLVIYTIQTFQYMYIWLLNLNWNNCIALKSGGPTPTLARPPKTVRAKAALMPPASDSPARYMLKQPLFTSALVNNC